MGKKKDKKIEKHYNKLAIDKAFSLCDVVKCKCKIPKPLHKCSENGISSYCGKCAKSL